jgi:hypothetical protein
MLTSVVKNVCLWFRTFLACLDRSIDFIKNRRGFELMKALVKMKAFEIFKIYRL